MIHARPHGQTDQLKPIHHPMKTKLLFLVAFCCCLIPAIAANHSLPPSATISYNSPFCYSSTSESVTLIGTTGGIFNASPSGLAIDPSTGSIQPSLSAPGNYVVTYTIPAGVDPEFQTTTTVQILAQPTAVLSGSSTVCSGTPSFLTITGTPNATVAYTVNGGASQTITLNASGAATITNYLFQTSTYCLQWVSNAGSNCMTALSSCATTIVIPGAYAGNDGQVSICDSDTSAVNLFSIISGEQTGGVWTRTAGTGGTFSAVTGIFTPTPGNTTTSSFVYTVNGVAPCGNDTATATINIGSEITIPGSFPNVTACMYYVLPNLQMGNYYTQPGGNGQMLAPGTEINWSQMIYVYAQSGTCSGETSFFVTIFNSIIPVFDPIPDQCLGAPPVALPSVSVNGVTGSWSPAMIDNTFAGTTIYTFTPDFDNCGAPTTLTVTVVPCAGIALNAFLDMNSNGTEDNGEPKFPLGHFDYHANDDGIIHQGFAPNGTYTINDYNGLSSYDVTYTIDAPNDVLYNITTPSYSNITPANPSPVYNFPVTVAQVHSEVQISITALNSPRAGNSCTNYITYANKGNVTIPAGTITFTQDNVLSFDVGNIPGLVETPTGFTYNFANLAPFESRTFWVSLSVPPLGTVSIGQLVTNSVVIAADDFLSDSASITQPIVAAYDPNDKVENHGGKIVFADFTPDDYLYYTIRFENTGNADAFDVRINDVLDTQLDESTVKLVSGSHPYVLEKTGNQLDFVFANINLPPSVANSDIGHGYVSFKVKPKSGYAIGDIIPNTASIYFDTNPAIDTDTFNTEFVTSLARMDFGGSSFVLYPNPANTAFRILSNNNTAVDSVRIFDLLGKLVLSEEPKSEGSIDVQSLDAGMYFVEVASAGKKSIQKLIVK